MRSASVLARTTSVCFIGLELLAMRVVRLRFMGPNAGEFSREADEDVDDEEAAVPKALGPGAAPAVPAVEAAAPAPPPDCCSVRSEEAGECVRP